MYQAVIDLCETAKLVPGTAKSSMVRDAAIAFRAAYGGPQPGSVMVEHQ